MREIKYCRKCGKKLKKGFARADKVNIWHNDGMGGCSFKADSPFDEETGEENIAETLTCPKWRKGIKGLFNIHDKIVKYEGEYYWL